VFQEKFASLIASPSTRLMKAELTLRGGVVELVAVALTLVHIVNSEV